MRRSVWSSGFVVAAVLGSVGSATRAEAQAQATEGAGAASEVPGLTPSSTVPMAVPEDLLHTSTGGLTADQVGQRAMDTSFSAKQALETMRAAQARVNAAWANFLPRLSGTARYTRLSSFTPPSFGTGNLVATNAPEGQINPLNLPPGVGFEAVSLTFPLVLDNYLLQATLTVPLSDYLFRIDQTYTAATHSADAARFDLGAARATALSNGKTAYYSWMQARGSVIVAVETLNDQRVHLTDARNQFTVGNASKADVLRAETAAAQAELAVVQAKNAADLAEVQMRVALHLPAGQPLVPGEGLDSQPPSFQGSLVALVDEGLANRYEVKSIKANARAARKTAEANKAGRYPVVSAFGDAIEANPNPRVFPATQTWTPTWDLGVQAIWAPNDILTANGTAADYEARANALEAQEQVTRENITVEVTQDFQAMKQAEFALDSTKRELASATEAYRVARELFNNGRGTSTTLLDAERDLFSARIDALTAAVNIRLARVRLEHGVGRDLARATASK
jgi:outer membrane protein TolC